MRVGPVWLAIMRLPGSPPAVRFLEVSRRLTLLFDSSLRLVHCSHREGTYGTVFISSMIPRFPMILLLGKLNTGPFIQAMAYIRPSPPHLPGGTIPGMGMTVDIATFSENDDPRQIARKLNYDLANLRKALLQLHATVSSMEVQQVVIDGAETYAGPYTVTPRKVGQVLGTNEKLMADDVTVNPITYVTASNSAGGSTATIGVD